MKKEKQRIERKKKSTDKGRKRRERGGYGCSGNTVQTDLLAVNVLKGH